MNKWVQIFVFGLLSCDMVFAVSPRVPYHPMGVTYSGLHATTSPSKDSVIQDIHAIKKYRDANGRRFTAVRTYYPQYDGGKIELLPMLASNNLKVLLGLYLFDPPHEQDWTTANYEQDVKPFFKNKELLGILVGNEDYPDRKLQINQYLDWVKKDAPSIAVSTAQTTNFWLNQSNDPDIEAIANKCDFIAVNIYPIWDWYKQSDQNQPLGRTLLTGVEDMLHALRYPLHVNLKRHFIHILRVIIHPMFTLHRMLPQSMHISDMIRYPSSLSPEQGFASFKAQYEAIHKQYPGKQIVVTETGWPTTYGEVVNVRQQPAQYQIGLDNAKVYYALVRKWSARNHVTVFYYSMFDNWYAVASATYSKHFGLLNTKRLPKRANVH